MSTPPFVRVQSGCILLSIKLQPRASANEIGEALGNELRMKVTAAPVDGTANQALINLLAETLDCPRNCIELVRGHTSRHKVVKVFGISEQEILAKLRGRV